LATRVRRFHLGAAALGLGLAGCAEKPRVSQHTSLPVYAIDLQGGAASCTVSKPTLAPGAEAPVTMTVANDGGWCAVAVSQDGPAPFAAGLLTLRPTHGNLLIHGVGDQTRIDYTPERGFTGSDAFAVRLIPGDAVIRAAVSVTPGSASVAPAAPPEPAAPAKRTRGS
jgi:hypothetical protein